MPIVKINKCLNCGISHEWIFEGMTLKELRVVKKICGMGQVEFETAGDTGDPEALAALLYVLHTRSKININFDDIDLDFHDFSMELTEQEQADLDAAVAQAELDKKANQSPKKPTNGRKQRAG